MMYFSDSTSAALQQMCPVMSWLLCLCLWVSVTAVQLCQATFYDTIQQHHGMRPGRTTVHMIGESFRGLSVALDTKREGIILCFVLLLHAGFG